MNLNNNETIILNTAKQVDHGSLSDTLLADALRINNASEWDFGSYTEEVQHAVSSIRINPNNIDDISRAKNILEYIQEIAQFLSDTSALLPEGQELRKPQKLALKGYIEFLLDSLTKTRSTGFIVVPTGQGKTRITVLLAMLSPKKSLYISLDTTGNIQAIKEWKTLNGGSDADIAVITPDEPNTKRMQIGSFEGFKAAYLNGHIDLKEYDAISIDEVDVNGLSTSRQEFLNSLLTNHNIRIIGLSATEHQASGKKITDFFEENITRLPMPESLIDLHKDGLVPNVTFRDVYLDATLDLRSRTKNTAKMSVSDEELDLFILNNNWITQIFDYHKLQFSGKNFILNMRNNKLNDTICKMAKNRGVDLRSFTGDETREEREELIQLFHEGKISIIGCRLTGRGLDLENADVVYNSLLTYSPQLFWQAGGRVMRVNPKNIGKHAHIINFLPKEIIETDADGSQSSVALMKRPLSFQAFLDRNFYSARSKQNSLVKSAKDTKEKTTSNNSEYYLPDLKEGDFQSIESVLSQLDAVAAYGSFTGRPELLSEMIDVFPGQISMPRLRDYLLRIKWNLIHEYMDDNRSSVSDEYRAHKDEMRARYMPNEKRWSELSIAEEKSLFDSYKSEQDPKKKKRIQGEILERHMPIIISIALKYESEITSVDDLIQSAVEKILKEWDKFKGGYRFSSWVAITSLATIMRSTDEQHGIIYTPTHQMEIGKKVSALLNTYDEHYPQSKSREQYLMDALGITRENVGLLLRIQDQKIISFDERNLDHTEDVLDKQSAIYIDPQIATERLSLQEDLTEVMKNYLTPREEKVLQMRFGLHDDKDDTLEEIGIKYDVQRERIRQIESKAIRKLGHPSRTEHIRTYLNEKSESIGNWNKKQIGAISKEYRVAIKLEEDKKFLDIMDVSNIRKILIKKREQNPFYNHFIISIDETNNFSIKWDIESHILDILEQAKELLTHTDKTLQWTSNLSGISLEDLPDNLLDLLQQSDFQHIFLRRTEDGFVIEKYESDQDKRIRIMREEWAKKEVEYTEILVGTEEEQAEKLARYIQSKNYRVKHIIGAIHMVQLYKLNDDHNLRIQMLETITSRINEVVPYRSSGLEIINLHIDESGISFRDNNDIEKYKIIFEKE